MKVKHVLVTLLDLPELLPFALDTKLPLIELMKAEEKAMKELFCFMEKIEAKFKPIYYIGQDVIGERFLHRFLIEGGGFIEVGLGKPCLIAAHFIDEKNAQLFKHALEEALREILPKGKEAELLISCIELSKEEMILEEWKKLRKLREELRS